MSFGGGSSGSGSISGSSDVVLSNPSNNQVLTYDGTTLKWKNATQSSGSGSGSTNWSDIGEVALDSFSGSTDSDKLDAAIAYCQNLAPYYPTIRMSARKYTFTRSIGQPYNGFSLVGAGRGQLGAISSSHPNYHTTIDLEIPRAGTGLPGYWIDASQSTAWDYYIGGFNAYSNNGFTQAYRAPLSAGGFRECNFVDQTWQNMYSVFGNSSEGCAMTICNIYGGWSIFECRDQGVTIQGSDCRKIFGDGVDWYHSSAVSAGNARWMGEFRSLGKSNIGPLYVTAYGGWRGIKVTGSASVGGLVINGAVLEGNNGSQPCDGSLLRIEGGNVIVRDTTIDDGMATPANTASANGGTADRGLVEVLGSAKAVFDGINIAHASGVANTTPAVYVSGSAEVRVSNFQRFDRGGSSWGTQLPVVTQATTGLVKSTDSSVQLIG